MSDLARNLFFKEAAALANVARVHGGSLGVLAEALQQLEVEIKMAPPSARQAVLTMLGTKSALLAVTKLAIEQREEMEELRRAANQNLAALNAISAALSDLQGGIADAVDKRLVDVGVIAPAGDDA